MCLRHGSQISIVHAREGRHFGGLERYILDLSLRLKDRGYSVSLVLSQDAPITREAHEMGMPYIAAPIHGDINPRTPFYVASALKKFQADILNVHDNAAAVPMCLGGHIARVPVVATVHAFHEKWAFSAADHLIAVSEALRDHLIADGISEDKITIVRNGVDLSLFTPVDREYARAELGLYSDCVYFAAINRLDRKKGLELLLDSFKLLLDKTKNARLLVVGTGSLEEKLKAQAVYLGIEKYVKFTGFLSDVRPILAASDCLVLSSESEGLGLILLEAMASGRAIIATDSGGPREVVRNGETGILIQPNKGEELLRSMLYVMDNPEWTREAGLAARLCAEEEHSIENEVDGVEAVYRKILRVS